MYPGPAAPSFYKAHLYIATPKKSTFNTEDLQLN